MEKQVSQISKLPIRVFPLLASILWLTVSGCSTLTALNPFSSAATGSEQLVSESAETGRAAVGVDDELAGSDNGETPLVDGLATSEETASGGIPTVLKRQPNSKETGTLELVWQVPGEPVEIYHLNVGYSKEHLDRLVEIPVGELKQDDDPVHGPVFRYQLSDVDENRPLFLTLSAENKFGRSAPSPVLKVDGGRFVLLNDGPK